jgi:hypothetical protein
MTATYNNILAALGLTIFLLGCAQPRKQQSTRPPVREERVSDRYSRKAVKSYALFDADIPHHVMMLVRLTTGERFPMLCRKTANGIYPISQSVFAEPGAKRWRIVCEPDLYDGGALRGFYALMRLELFRVDGALFIGDRRLKPFTKTPLLFRPSLEARRG